VCGECESDCITPTGELHYATDEETKEAGVDEAVTIGTPPDLMHKWQVMNANIYTDGKKEANKVLREVRKHFGDYDPKRGMFGGLIKGAKAVNSGVTVNVVVNTGITPERFLGGLKDALAKTGLELKGSAFEVKEVTEAMWPGTNKTVKKGQKVRVKKAYTTKDMDNKTVTIKKGVRGRISYVDIQGEFHVKWATGVETHDMMNAEVTDYIG
jgi:hypothetical protein